MNGKASAGGGTGVEPPYRPVYRLPEAGQLLGGITRNTVKALIRAGDLETVPIGAYQMVTRKSIEAYIERGRQRSRAAA
ncbi:helix-turn-helix domain-containing protein [Micromonospora haikouensis]|uniref:helix-turn-helix domain-containing protein n=1 Tax=Micromonospora haikouensis TaxID=686309 RepID=UPI0037910B7C